MIKQVVLNRTNTLDGNNKIFINFSKGINIIVGPKGGGKSTLFDLVASINKNYLPKNVIDTFKNYDLEIDSILKFSNEKINSDTLEVQSVLAKNKDFSQRNDVIFQDDPIKKNLNNLNEITKAKEKFCEKTLYNSISIRNFVDTITNFYHEMKQLHYLFKNEINWTTTLEYKKNNLDKNKFIEANYSIKSTIGTIDIEISNNNSLKSIVKENNSNLKTIAKSNLTPFTNDEEYNRLIIEKVNFSIIENNNLISIIDKKINEILRIKKTLIIFNNSYKLVVERIKEKDKKTIFDSYFQKAKNYFCDMSNVLINQRILFENLINQDVEINFDSSDNEFQEMLSFKMQEKILLTSNEILDILKTVFHTPNKSINDINSWLIELNKKGSKDFNDKKILKKLIKILVDKVIVMANNKNYETMSLGEKSIYGIKYKFNNTLSGDIFLDQPEDNLDNHTIATEILNLIKLKNKSQIFIVTHNANIGLLSNPNKVIVADLSNLEIPYCEGEIISRNEDNEFHSATFYLEGGKDFLIKRYNKIKE